MESEDDFVWLLKVLKQNSRSFELLYGISFEITDTIILKDKLPACWFYMTKDKKIKQRKEDWLNKIKVLQEFLNNQNLTSQQVSELQDQIYPQIDSLQNGILSDNSKQDEEPLFYFYQAFKTTKGVIRLAQKHVVDGIFKNQDYQEVMKSWNRIIMWKPINLFEKPQLYVCKYKVVKQEFFKNPNKQEDKDLEKDFSIQLSIERKMVQGQKLIPEEYIQKQQPKLDLDQIDKKDQYKSLSNHANEKLTTFTNAIVRVIESKFDYQVYSLQIECFINSLGHIWLVNSEEVILMDETNEPLNKLDKGGLTEKLPETEIPYVCPGIYCECQINNIFFDENDETFSLFMMANTSEQDNKALNKKKLKFKKDFKYIQQKSIIMDIVERVKTQFELQRLDYKQSQIIENLIFHCRRFFSISQILNDNNFKHLKVENLYEKVRVCDFCFCMYSKLDQMRIKKLENKGKQEPLDKKFVQLQIEKLTNPQGIVPGTMLKDKKSGAKFSKKFYDKIKEFNIEIEKFNKDYDLKFQEDDQYFKRKYIPAHKLELNYISSPKNKNLSEGNQRNFRLPKIMVATLTDKAQLLKKRNLYVKKEESEALGLKHYLGHTKHLPYSDCGLAISKSSLALNNLQDKIQKVQKVKERIEKEKIQLVKKEIDLMMCPYYGKGQRDNQNLKEFINKLKQREIEDQEKQIEETNQIIQVVTDKNEFLNENQRKQKQDLEKKERDLQQSKKNFLEVNSQLAESVLKKIKENKSQNQKSRQHSQIEFPHKENQY